MGKKDTLQTTLIEDQKQKEKMAKFDEEVAEGKAIAAGPFQLFVKGNDGKIFDFTSKSLWRAIFALGQLLHARYSGQFEKGVVIKIVKKTEAK